jgi:CDP-glucose 4,6-dehydratase
MNRSFWSGKRVVVTGHSGFKGTWLTLWLSRLGARVTGISLPPLTSPHLFGLVELAQIAHSHFCDIRDAERLGRLVLEAQPEIVFHLAAQPLVLASYRDPLETFSTNVQGTVNVLEALRPLHSVRVVVAVTTDKVYKDSGGLYPRRETDPLGGHDPYSASKAAAEIIVESYRAAYFGVRQVAVASARAGNVIGGGDWSHDRLLPDAVRAWSTRQVLSVRRPSAIRPWQHVLDALSAYIVLAEHLHGCPQLAGAYNFGPPSHRMETVRQVVELARKAYGAGDVAWGDGTDGPHEAGYLALETAKARSLLGVATRWSVAEAVRRTIDWYRQQHQCADARTLCEADIVAYEAGISSGAIQ